jgi:hypothetical protein
MNSVRAELPERGEGRLLQFVVGAFGYAILLMLIQLAEKNGHAGAITF